MRHRHLFGFGTLLRERNRSKQRDLKHGSVLRQEMFARRLRCEPLEDRRMLAILMVDADAASGGDGLAWASAYDDLQTALVQAAALNTDGNAANDVDQIWIAEGAYTPSAELEPGDTRSVSFSLLDGVTLYGGFAGNETVLTERDFSTYVTTLCGDLGTIDDTSDNAYTVVYCGGNIEAAIDGLSIVDGNADQDYDSNHYERSYGGGIYNRGTLTVRNSTLSDNSACDGGGIVNDGSSGTATLTITNSMLTGNSGNRYGGGIYNKSGSLTLTNCTLSDNSASYGGGISNGSDMLTLLNCTLSGNSVSNDGGGIYHSNLGRTTLTNCTLSGNSAGNDGGGICVYSATTFTLNNTIVAGNSASSGPDIYFHYGTLTGSHNLIGNGTGQSLLNGVDGNIVGTKTNPIDPMLGPLQDNGGPTLTHAPLPGSPLIDAGSDLVAVDSWDNPLVADQRNFFSRIFGTVDIGAVEDQPSGVPVAHTDAFQWNQPDSLVFHSSDILANDICNDGNPLAVAIFTDPEHGDLVSNPDGTYTYTPEPTFWGTDSFTYKAVNGSLESIVTEVVLSVVSPESVLVTTVDDEDDGDLSSGDISLREALANASTSQVQFDIDLLYQTIYLEMEELNASNVQVVGLGARYLTIYGQRRSSVFHIIGDTLITHLSITKGSADLGGGIYNEGTLTLTNSKLFDNLANSGGGIYNEGTLTLTNSELLSNIAYSSGSCGGGIYNAGTLTLTNSTLWNNQTYGDGGGGGIYNHSDSGIATLTVISSSLCGNSACGGRGGGIYNEDALTLTNSKLAHNTADHGGGGIYNYGHTCTATLTNTTLSNNSAGDGGGIYHSNLGR
ncbi:MAG: cadherin-like domain-containing protein, partial [Pirellulales bacterium]|nr:cadherin-like domain-containing protein [Pirellulales bacterium]